MSKFKRVGTGTIEFIQNVGCSNDCSKTIPINKGLPLPCKEFTNMESALFRRRALKDDQLWESGFTRIIERSAIGDDLRIKDFRLDIGEIRTEASGARSLTECKYNYEGITVDAWEKRFYVVNTNKHLKLCPRDLVGSNLQDLIGNKMTDFDNFQDTDLADILIGAIIEKYNTEFVAKFILLAVWDGAGENMHGDDGIFAKAWYAYKGQYFHTMSYDLSSITTGMSLEAIVGGKRYSKSLASFGGTLNSLLLDFVTWVNNLKDTKEFMFNTSVDLATGIITVVSRFATSKIRLRVAILNAGETADWSSPQCSHEDRVPTQVLQNAMPINDVPLMFKNEEINETNFVPLFKRYLKEFVRYLHRNGFSDISIEDIKIAIDPELMLERDDAVAGKYLAGGIPIDFMKEIGLSDSRFFPMNALNATGLFMMGIDGNIGIFGDSANDANGLPGTGTVKITDICDGQFSVIFDNPIGSMMDNFGASAFNLCDSFFVLDNKLDDREPYENTRGVLACYSDACKGDSLVISCSVKGVVSSTADFDGTNTNITVLVNVSNPNQVPTINYNLGYSLSDGTSASGITSPSFVITVPGDQTASGLVLNVFGQVSGSNAVNPNDIATTYCVDTLNYSVKLGTAPVLAYCDWSGTKATAGGGDDKQLGIIYDAGAGSVVVHFIDQNLDLSNTSDWAAIESEIEAIFPGSVVTITGTGANPEILIENVIDTIVSIGLQFSAAAELVFASSCI